jgi:hypothetical protein
MKTSQEQKPIGQGREAGCDDPSRRIPESAAS